MTPPPPPAKSEELIEVAVEELCKSFGRQSVLTGVNLTIRRGELVAIVGGSGCGKTVLLKTITGHFRPDSGRVLIANHDVPGSPVCDLSRLSDDELDRMRVHWAVVFQRNALLSGSVYFNLAFWPKEIKEMQDAQIMPLARKALLDVGLNADEIMHRDREALSGGMAKRLAIARALVMDPVLIFYDEPTAGLDPEMCGNIHSLIDSTHRALPAQGVPRTSIVVTHDTELLRRLEPRIVMLFAGKVFFDGTYKDFVGRDDPHIRPYVQQMPALHARRPSDY
ncbi:MAG: ATP-binding cassette domain-containing protein [Planctomycetes bacterium]|nr:ATP-binding cassette domain-containing protein [Planctomycetota bacterium]